MNWSKIRKEPIIDLELDDWKSRLLEKYIKPLKEKPLKENEDE